MLHITNGDAAAGALARAGFAHADILPWRDVLHEGPVPEGLRLDELSSVRAQFLADCGFGDYDSVRESFAERDFRLAGAQAEDEVVMWFESDLYDQLQLMQLLDWFADAAHRPSRLSLIEVDRLPISGQFEALSSVEPERAKQLMAARQAVTDLQLSVASACWAAFRKPQPTSFAALLEDNRLGCLPYLADAMLRMLEELPGLAHGLSRTELRSIECLAEQPRSKDALFRAVQHSEPRPFLGDVWFWRHLDRLQGRPPLREQPRPLIEAATTAACPPFSSGEAVLSLTDVGHRVLERNVDALDAIGIDLWWGGTRVWQSGTVWRWDGASVVLSRATRV